MVAAIPVKHEISDNTTQNPRISIIQRETNCLHTKAAKALRKLDEYDQAQQRLIRLTIRKPPAESRYTRFHDLLSPARSALVQHGYSTSEATLILTILLNRLSEVHGGRSTCLPSVTRMQKMLSDLEA